MSRKYETRPIPATTRQVLIERACDMCGRKANPNDWSGLAYEVDDTEVTVTVKHRKGESYPEGGCETVIEVDLCPTCFKGELIPWLKSRGVVIVESESDW